MESCPKNKLLSCFQVALLCVQASAADRPTLSVVISSLTNDVIFLQEPKEPTYATKSETRFTLSCSHSLITCLYPKWKPDRDAFPIVFFSEEVSAVMNYVLFPPKFIDNYVLSYLH